VGLLAAKMVNRWGRPAIGFLAVAAVFSFALAISWTATRQLQAAPFRTDQVVSFMNRDDHAKFRYLTLGFGSAFARVARDVNASSVDGDYNSARMLPELTKHGAAQLYNSKYFGTAGMEALRDVLKHDQKYGLKYVFVRDRFYEPLLAFAGWRQAEIYDNGNVTLWVKDDVQPAKPVPLPQPPAWHGRSSSCSCCRNAGATLSWSNFRRLPPSLSCGRPSNEPHARHRFRCPAGGAGRRRHRSH
jgi:hypothetical protein